MDETHVWCFLRKGFEGCGDQGGQMTARSHQGDFAAGDVLGIERPFVGSIKDARDAPETGAMLE